VSLHLCSVTWCFQQREILQGGKSGLDEEKSQGVNCMEVFVQGFFALVRELQEGEARVYAGCKRANHVCMQVAMGTVVYTWVAVEQSTYYTQVGLRRIAYIVLWARASPYRMTSDIIMSYKWSAADLWAKEVSCKLLRFGFFICMVIGGQGCPQILVIFVLAERQGCPQILVIFVLAERQGCP
jgi:hypothetical protein